MKTSSNGNRLNSAIPIGIDEKSLAALALEMGERLDQFLTTEAPHDHNKSTQVMMQELSFAEAANALGGRIAITGAADVIRANRKAKERDKKAAEDRHFQELIRQLQQDNDILKEQVNDLNDEINALQKTIRKYEEELDAIKEMRLIIQAGGEIDPDNHAHYILLLKSGIPPEEWHKINDHNGLYLVSAENNRKFNIWKHER